MNIYGYSTLQPRASFRALLLATSIDDEPPGARPRKVTGFRRVGIDGKLGSTGSRDVYLSGEDLDVGTRCDVHDQTVRFIRTKKLSMLFFLLLSDACLLTP
jgi:hypothetical protein